MVCAVACTGSSAAVVDAPLPDAALPDAAPPDAALPDANLPDGPETLLERCQRLRREWADLLVGVDTSCQTPADCQAVGYTRDTVGPTCDCIAAISGTSPRGIHAGTYPAQAAALEDEFVRDCAVQLRDELGWVCDEGVPDVFCGGHCSTQGSHLCFPPP